MSSTDQLPFDCPRCNAVPLSEMTHYTPTDVWVKVYGDERLAHVHFGRATNSDEESTAETQWVYDNMTLDIEKEHPGISFFSISDVSRADDSELPSEETKKLYKKMLNNPQNAQLVFYGATHSMTFMINMIKHLVGVPKLVKVVRTLEDAEAHYDAWAKKELV